MATSQKTIQIGQHRQSIEVTLDPAAKEVDPAAKELDPAVGEQQPLPASNTAA